MTSQDCNTNTSSRALSLQRFSWVLLGVSLLVACSSVCLPHWLPFQDLPAHAGHLAVRERLASSPFEQQYLLESAKLGPYSLFRGLGHALSPLLGPLGAIRGAAILPMLLTPLSALWLRRRVAGVWDPAYALLGLYSTLGLMLMFGFASFLTGTAILIASYTFFLALPEATHLWRAVALAAASALLTFYAHGFALLMLGILSLAAASYRVSLTRALCMFLALLPAGAAAVWSIIEVRSIAGLVSRSEDTAQTLFQGPLAKLSLLASPMLLTRFGVDVALGMAVWGTLAAASWRWRKQAGLDAGVQSLRARRGALLLLAVFVVAPHNAHWFGFVDGRLLPTVYLLIAASLPAAWWTSRARALLGCTVLAQCTLLGGSVLLFQHEMAGFEQARNAIPANQRVLHLPLSTDSAFVVGHPFVHADKLLLLEQPELLSDMWLHQGTGLYARAQNPSMHLPLQYSGTALRAESAWKGILTEEWDYALVHSPLDATVMRKVVPATWCLRTHAQMWFVFQRDQKSAPCPTAP